MSSCFGTAPGNCSISLPASKIKKDGTLKILYFEAICGLDSISTLATRIFPFVSAAICSTWGPVLLQTLHQGAHPYSKTGKGESRTDCWKLASVTITVLPEKRSLCSRTAPQRPHFPPAFSLLKGTRFLVRHSPHRSVNTGSASLLQPWGEKDS